MRRTVLFLTTIALVLGLAPRPALARGFPQTLAAQRAVGALAGAGAVVRPGFPVGYLGVSWISGSRPAVRFLHGSRWSRWTRVEFDDLPSIDGRRYSALVPGGDASAYQLRGSDRGVEATAINTTDGPRPWVVGLGTGQTAGASLSQPGVISRTAWGADESYRFDPTGKEVWPPAFYPTQKLIVHHTAGQNDDPDPAATVRAIYYYHAVTRGYGDIGYNFLVDAQGRVYKGRYSGPPGTRDQDTLTGTGALNAGVTAAHTQGYNSGTVGIAILGTYTSVPVPVAARSSLVDFLAWESDRAGLDPQGSSTFVNPVSGVTKFAPNITGHRDWAATECPGGLFYADLPNIRADVAAKLAASGTPPPDAPVGLSASALSSTRVDLSWTDVSTETGYRVERSPDGSTWTAIGITGQDSITYSDSSATENKTYSYRVEATNAGGSSPPSNVATATTPGTPPTQPSGLTATGGKRKVILSWAASSDSGGSGLAGYEVWWSAGGSGGPFSKIATTTATTYTNGGLMRGVTYWYDVVAYDGAGNRSAPSNIVSARAN